MASRWRLLVFFMRVYPVPPDMSEKEKVIGGVLNINQFFWLVVGILLGVALFFLLNGILGSVFALFFSFPFLLSGTPFAFYKKNGLTLFRYLVLKKKFKNKVKKLPNTRKTDDISDYLRSKY